MAKIQPTADITRATPRGRSSVARIGVVPQVVDEGYGGMGKALRNLAIEHEDNRNRYEYNKAKNDFLILKTKQDRAFDQDEDYKTFDNRYTGALNEGLGQIAGNISDLGLRNEFVSNSQVHIEQGRTRIGDLAWNKERDFERSAIGQQLVSLREVGLTDDMVVARDQVNDVLDSGVKMGWVKREEAGEMFRAWKNDTAIGRLEMMAPENRVEALKQPWAKELPGDTRAKLIRESEDSVVATKAIATVQKYLDDELDETVAREKMRKIGNTKLRKETERRWDYAYGKQQIADLEQQSEVSDNVLDFIKKGKTIDQYREKNSDKFDLLTPGQENNLYRAEAASVKGRREHNNQEVIKKLRTLRERGEYIELRRFFLDNFDELNKTNYDAWRKIAIDGETPDDVESLLTFQQQVAAKIKTKTDRPEMNTAMDKWYMDYQRRNQNKLPSDDEVSKAIDGFMMNIVLDKGFIWDTDSPLFKITDEEWSATWVSMDSSDWKQTAKESKDPKTLADTRGYFINKGYAPTRAEFIGVYQRLRNSRGTNR